MPYPYGRVRPTRIEFSTRSERERKKACASARRRKKGRPSRQRRRFGKRIERMLQIATSTTQFKGHAAISPSEIRRACNDLGISEIYSGSPTMGDLKGWLMTKVGEKMAH